VRGERKSIQVESPRGNKVASIDLGINVLASVVLNDGTWLLYKGVRTKEDYFYLEKRIAQVQSLADETRNQGEYEAYEELLEEKRRLHGKLTRRLLHLYRNFASHLLKTLHEQGASMIYLGYPLNDLSWLPPQHRSGQGQQVRIEYVVLPQVDGHHRTEGSGIRNEGV